MLSALRRAGARAFAGAIVVVAIHPCVAFAEDRSGARLAFSRIDPSGSGSAVVTVGVSGGNPWLVAAEAGDDVWAPARQSSPSWSLDGEMLAIAESRSRQRRIAVVSPGGGDPRPVPGTGGGFLPVFSPDGRTLAFARARYRPGEGERALRGRYESVSTWLLDLTTGERRQLTSWRDELTQFPTSFSPDGTTLLVNRIDAYRSGYHEVVAVRFGERSSGLLIGVGLFPVYSPDGSAIATYKAIGDSNTEIFLVRADGSHMRRLTHTPRYDEILPSWDPSGERIAFIRAPAERDNLGPPSAVVQMNADGTCRRPVIVRPSLQLLRSTWRPGPGRGAGRIECRAE